MGYFNSFRSQIGRDTGKVVSNFVWGDKHASVYRRAKSRDSESKQKEMMTFKIEAYENKIAKVLEVVDLGINKVVSMKVPQKKELLTDMLQELSVLIIANPWGSVLDEESKITNKYSDAIYAKFEHALLTLKSKYPKDFEYVYFEKQFFNLKKSRSKKKYSGVILYTILGVVAFCIFGIIGYDEYAAKEGKSTFVEKIESVIK